MEPLRVIPCRSFSLLMQFELNMQALASELQIIFLNDANEIFTADSATSVETETFKQRQSDVSNEDWDHSLDSLFTLSNQR